MSSGRKLLRQSELERASIMALSRPEVVSAYSNWWDISEAELLCLEMVLDPDARVLDIGCGAGRHARWFDGRFKFYVGIDASAPMVEAARKNFPMLDFYVEDILQCESEDNCWDTILLMGNVLDFLNPEERRSELLERCFNWLRPGGTVVGSSHLTRKGEKRGYYAEEYHQSEIHQYRLSASEMVAEVERFGFEISLFVRDYRKQPAHWAYWVARRLG